MQNLFVQVASKKVKKKEYIQICFGIFSTFCLFVKHFILRPKPNCVTDALSIYILVFLLACKLLCLFFTVASQ